MGGSVPILTLFEFRNPYGKMDRPLWIYGHVSKFSQSHFLIIANNHWSDLENLTGL